MSVNPLKSIPLLRDPRTSYNRMAWGCQSMLKFRSWLDTGAYCNLSRHCLRDTSILVPWTFKYKVLMTLLIAT